MDQRDKGDPFRGNNYSDEWVVEAAKRGLPNLRKTPEALAQLKTSAAKKLFKKSGVHTNEELEARYHLEVERYIKDLEIETSALREIARTMVLPAAYKHQANLVAAVTGLADLGVSKDSISGQVAEIQNITDLISGLNNALISFDQSVEKAETDNIEKKAEALAYRVSPEMEAVREYCDKLEGVVDDTLWPLPKYREMLFLC